jgi:hypothetical protein
VYKLIVDLWLIKLNADEFFSYYFGFPVSIVPPCVPGWPGQYSASLRAGRSRD